MTNICHNARVVYLRQSSATLFARCNSRVLCSLAGGAVMSSSVCLYAIKCTRERIVVQNVHACIAHQCIALCVQVLCVVGVDPSTSFAFRCLCHLKSTSPSLNSPESVQRSNSRNSPSGRVLAFKYIFGTTL